MRQIAVWLPFRVLTRTKHAKHSAGAAGCREAESGEANRTCCSNPCPLPRPQYSQYSSFPGLSLALPCLWSLPLFPMADTDGPACAPAVSWSPISSLSQVRNQPSSTQPLAARGFDCRGASCPIYAAQVTVSDRHSRIARHRQYIAKLLPIKCPPRPLYIRLSVRRSRVSVCGTPPLTAGLRALPNS